MIIFVVRFMTVCLFCWQCGGSKNTEHDPSLMFIHGKNPSGHAKVRGQVIWQEHNDPTMGKTTTVKLQTFWIFRLLLWQHTDEADPVSTWFDSSYPKKIKQLSLLWDFGWKETGFVFRMSLYKNNPNSKVCSACLFVVRWDPRTSDVSPLKMDCQNLWT